MDEETVIKAAAMAAVLCRVVDYALITHRTYEAMSVAPAGKSVRVLSENIASAEKRVVVALENLLDVGLE